MSIVDVANVRHTDDELARHWLWRLMDYESSLQRRFRRHAFSMCATALLFELLKRGLISEASGSGFKLSSLDFLKYWMPPVFAWFYVNMIFASRDASMVSEAREELERLRFPSLSRSRVAELVGLGRTPLVGSLPPRTYVHPTGYRLRWWFQLVQAVVLFAVLPLGFVVYGGAESLRLSPTDDRVMLLSGLLPTMMVLLGIYYLGSEPSSRGWWGLRRRVRELRK